MSLECKDSADLKNIQVSLCGDNVLLTVETGSVILNMGQTDKLIQLLLMSKMLCKENEA